MPLSDRQARSFIQALDAAFDLRGLSRMLRQELGVDLASITQAREKRQAIGELLSAAENEGWSARLMQAARSALPHNAELQTAADQLGQGPRLLVAMRPNPLRQRRINGPTLQKIIRSANSMRDLPAWREKLGQIEYQVCRIDLRQAATGTGFLVGPDLVMTCYHVVEDVIRGAVPPNQLQARFDFKITRDQQVLNPGQAFALADDWLVDASPYNPQEARGQPDAAIQLDQLDYAILRLKEAPGSQPVSDQAVDRRPRGWIELPDHPIRLEVDSPLFIVQHPSGGTLKLALDTQAVLGLNANHTRVRYRTNTETGASGSPCFDSDWELVALHHSGIVQYNEGIPIERIVALLKQHGQWPLPISG